MFWKKHWPRCFWRCSKKAETSCSRCILAMFLLTILNELKNCSKFFEICDKLWQQYVYSNNLLTKILAWQAILYQRGINIVGPNHFWRCGPRPKTSRKTSHFLLNDAMFQRCFEKNIDLDVFDDVWKKPKHRTNDASNDVNRPPLSKIPYTQCNEKKNYWRKIPLSVCFFASFKMRKKKSIYERCKIYYMADVEHLALGWRFWIWIINSIFS